MLYKLDKPIIGAVMMISTAVFFSVMALFVRLASETVPVGMIVFTRYVISTALIGLLFLVGNIRIRPVNRRLILYRSLTASLGGVFYFFAVSSITIAEAVILKYTFPLFAVTIAAILYREKTDRLVHLLLVLSIIGVVVMMNSSSFNPQFGYIWGILNGLFAGAAVAFVRKLRITDDSSTIMFFTSLMGIIVSTPFLVGGIVLPDAAGLLYILCASVFGFLAQFSVVYGIKYIKTGSACVIMMVEVVLSSILGFIVFGHALSPSKIIGGSLIIIGGILITIREGFLNTKSTQEQTSRV